MAEVDLHGAARTGDLATLGTGIAAGADVNARDRLKRTPLHIAAWAGQVRFHPPRSWVPTLIIIIILMIMKIIWHLPSSLSSAFSHLPKANPPRLSASFPTLSSRLSSRLNPSSERNEFNLSLFFSSIPNFSNASLGSRSSEQLDAVKFLVASGAKLSMEAMDGISPLHFACQRGHLDIARELINSGANPKVRSLRSVSTSQNAIHHLNLIIKEQKRKEKKKTFSTPALTRLQRGVVWRGGARTVTEGANV